MSADPPAREPYSLEIVGELTPEAARRLPLPGAGRFVYASHDGPQRPMLALAWEGDGRLFVKSASYLLITADPRTAPWMPKKWELSVFPVSLAQSPIEQWLDFAVGLCRNKRPDLVGHAENDRWSSSGVASAPRDLVSHAHLLTITLGIGMSTPTGIVSYADAADWLESYRAAFQRHFEHCDPRSPVDENSRKVLQALADAAPLLNVNADIEAKADLSKQTVGFVVNSLIERGLAHRPEGERKGATITEAGRRLIAELMK